MAGNEDYKPNAKPMKNLQLYDHDQGSDKVLFGESGYESQGKPKELTVLIDELTRMQLKQQQQNPASKDSGIHDDILASNMLKVSKAHEAVKPKRSGGHREEDRDPVMRENPETYSRDLPRDDSRDYGRDSHWRRDSDRRDRHYDDPDRRDDPYYGPDRRGDPYYGPDRRGDPYYRPVRHEDSYYAPDRGGDPYYEQGRRGDPHYSPERSGDPYYDRDSSREDRHTRMRDDPGYRQRSRDDSTSYPTKTEHNPSYQGSKRHTMAVSEELPPILAGHPLAEQLRNKKEIDDKKDREKISPEAVSIHKHLRNGIYGKRLNILLVGMTGVGKSSLVNSMLMALNEQGYKELAPVGYYGLGGKGGRAAVTLNVKGHQLFNKKFFLKGSPELKYACQPVVFDCPGFVDTDDPNVIVLLRKIIKGQVPDDTNVKTLLHMAGPDLKKWGGWRDKSRQIDAVIVVHAATDPIHEELLNAIRDAAMPDEQGALVVPVFGVISKIDTLKDPVKDVEVIEDALAEQLGVVGSENKIFCTRLYHKDVKTGMKRKPDIDFTMCKILQILLENVSPKHENTGIIGKILRR